MNLLHTLEHLCRLRGNRLALACGTSFIVCELYDVVEDSGSGARVLDVKLPTDAPTEFLSFSIQQLELHDEFVALRGKDGIYCWW